MKSNLPISGIVLTTWGIASIIAGVKNKGLMFMVLNANPDKKYNRLLNLFFGGICVYMGIWLLLQGD